MANKRFYKIWEAMKGRCNNPSDNSYSRYGGRGIKVCERWNKFSNFEKDMFSSYSLGLTIERVDNNGDYEPGNCRWATVKEQANNRRSNHPVTYKGTTKNLNEWIEQLGLKGSTVRQRFYVYKWDVTKCFEFKRGCLT